MQQKTTIFTPQVTGQTISFYDDGTNIVGDGVLDVPIYLQFKSD